MALWSAIAFLAPLLLCSAAQKANFDNYRLILMWPGSYCTSASEGVCCLPYTGEPAVDFLVQDLQTWKALVQVKQCSKTRFYINAINSDVRAQMIPLWTTIQCPSASPQEMWKNTWNISGTCSGANETVFFQTGLNLASQANVLKGLRTYGILPSNTRQYPYKTVQNALQKTVGKKTVVICNKNADGKSQIYNVHVCAAANGTTIIDCKHTSATCTASVMLPLFTVDMLADASAAAADVTKMVVPK